MFWDNGWGGKAVFIAALAQIAQIGSLHCCAKQNDGVDSKDGNVHDLDSS
jgi:hypothetical protein